MKRYWAARSLTSAGILIFSCCLMAHSLAAQGVDESRIRFSGDGGKVPEPGGKDSGGPVPRLADGTPNLGRTETRGGVHPIELIQLPEQKRIIQLMEFPGHNWRDIFLDGRPHPPKEQLENSPTFMGHSVGHWESDTLVVDTVGFNEGTWIDKEGHPHTTQLHWSLLHNF